ncbi:TIGR02452 family protein [Dorea formicigenerans]|uniref:TIGR02452 family protein n=1 Tax=Dorea formicigenerans TaxID=39486 RepID=A0A412KHE4_9FIRM|nr:TIGR02452 family protein [Dorea formicigenerans]
MAREDLIKIFENTVWMCDTNQKLMDKIKNSMAYNKVISEKNADDILQNLTHETGKEAEIIVSKKRSFEAASAYRGKHISVLNFASATNPGGGVTKGASAQEECLCRVSTLYKCISASEITEAFHKKHWRALKTGKMDSFYNDDCIQTCNVTVFKSDTAKTVLLPEKDWFDVDVISCAAPNLRRMSQHDKQWKKNVTDQELLDIYKKRINRVLDIARYAKSEVVILGAFGCGAFANPPELVAKAMHASIDEHKYDFETIELAVYCPLRDTSNYEVFAKEFSA